MGLMKLYGPPSSGSVARVIACLEEKGVADYELIPVDMPAGEHKQPPHIHRNPFGLVPALEDGDLMLFDSRAISRYIATKYKHTGPDLLRHSNLQDSAMVNVWMEVETTQFNPLISPIIYHCLVAPMLGLAGDENAVASNVAKLGLVLDVYEARLAGAKYLAGDFFSLADLHHLPSVHYLLATPYGGPMIGSRPRVKAWWEAVSARPACKKVIAPMSFSK